MGGLDLAFDHGDHLRFQNVETLLRRDLSRFAGGKGIFGKRLFQREIELDLGLCPRRSHADFATILQEKL